MAQNKTRTTRADPAAHIAKQTGTRKADAEILLAMMAGITGEKPVMWGPSIIGFGCYHYTYASGREGDMFLTGFAPRARETVVYIVGEVTGQNKLLARLGEHRMGKSCLYVKNLEAIDLNTLEDLIAKSVAALKRKYPVSTRTPQ